MMGYDDYMLTPEAIWFSRVPGTWRATKMREFFSERITKVSDKDYPPLSVGKMGVVPQLETAVKTDHGDNRKLIKKGDFAINSRSDRKGSGGMSEYEGSASLIITVLKPQKEINRKFCHYLLRSHYFSEEFYRNGHGLVSDLWTTRWDKMRNIYIPVPPRNEQDQIVRFLDWKVSSFNKLVSTKQKQIATLKEFMQAEIERQLCAYPVNETVRLKHCGFIYKGGGFSRDNLVEDEEFPAILYGDIYTQYEYKTSVITHHIDNQAYLASLKITNGDIVMTGTGETKDEIGKPILYIGHQIVAVGGDVIVFRPNKGINAEYLLYQLYGQSALKHRYVNGKGDIIVHIYPTALGNTLISLPNNSDQRKVVAQINEMIDNVKKTIAVLKEEISVLREYKTRLISDAVTGKIDVRNVEIPDYEYIEEEVNGALESEKEPEDDLEEV